MRKGQKGAAILIITVILLTVALLGMVYLASEGVFQQKTAANQTANTQAFEAAEAGVEFGLLYLNANTSTILASASGGYINYGPGDSNITNITLTNNSKYSIVYTNPTQNNYNILTITSSGVGPDGASTRAVREQVIRSTSSLSTATTIGNISSKGVGGNITGISAISSGGTADPAAVASGTITSNDSTLSSMTGDQLFMSIFGVSKATMQSQSTYYSNGSHVPWASLSGINWINSNVTLASNTTSGSVASPIVLIINGNLTMAGSGTPTINGIVYVIGTASLAGTSVINGLLFSEGGINFFGTSNLDFNSTIANNLLGSGSIIVSYLGIPGSWKDY